MKFRNQCLALLLLWLTMAAPTAMAVHLDIELKGETDRVVAGFCLTPGVGCDLPPALAKLGLPVGQLPRDGESGEPIFVADFADFPKPYDTANPGFNAVAGALIPEELLAYRALDKLMFWDTTQKAWRAADANVQIRLFGGLSATQVVTDPSQCGGFLICVPQGSGYEEGSTVFSAFGIQGARSLIIDNANSQGSLHTHLDWFLEMANGDKGGPVGAYLVKLQLGSNRRTQASAPLMIAFNSGLSDDQFAEAIASRLVPPAVPKPPSDPVVPTPNPPVSPPPAITPVTTVEERAFATFAYGEQGREKLTGCNTRCRKIAQGTSPLEATIALNGQADMEALASIKTVTLLLGTHTVSSAVAEVIRKPVNGTSGSSRVKSAVTDSNSGTVGKLDMNWTTEQLRVRYKLSTPVFSEQFLSDAVARGSLLESVAIKGFDANGTLLLNAKITAEIVPNGAIRTKQIRRAGSTYPLSSIRLLSRAQSK